MKMYTTDVRERAVAAVARGVPRAVVVTTLGLSPATLARWLRQQRTTGAVAPRPRPGRPPRLAAALDAGIVAHLVAQPDATLAEHCAGWAASTGQVVSPATLRRAIARAGWTRKKRA